MIIPIYANNFQGGFSTQTLDYSKLKAICQIYNTQSTHEAPVSIGQPTATSPAYGWIKSLSCDQYCLFADIQQYHPELESIINLGLYDKIQIQLYPDLLLRAVNIKGAYPPVVQLKEQFLFNQF